jgi:hypothetical protein
MKSATLSKQNKDRFAKLLADRIKRALKERSGDEDGIRRLLDMESPDIQNLTRGALNLILEEERLREDRFAPIISRVLFPGWFEPSLTPESYRTAVYSAVTRLRSWVYVTATLLSNEFGLDPLVLKNLIRECRYRTPDGKAIPLFHQIGHERDLAPTLVQLSREACRHIHPDEKTGFPQHAFG